MGCIKYALKKTLYSIRIILVIVILQAITYIFLSNLHINIIIVRELLLFAIAVFLSFIINLARSCFGKKNDNNTGSTN